MRSSPCFLISSSPSLTMNRITLMFQRLEKNVQVLIPRVFQEKKLLIMNVKFNAYLIIYFFNLEIIVYWIICFLSIKMVLYYIDLNQFRLIS